MRAIVFAALLVAACGPGSRRDGSGDDDGSGSGSNCPTCSTLTGKVYAPKWAPGDVPPGQEIPIFGAILARLTRMGVDRLIPPPADAMRG